MTVYLNQCTASIVAYVTPFVHTTKAWISDKIHVIWMRINDTIRHVLPICKPWFERTIRSLTAIDYVLMVTNIVVACVIIKVSLAILGIPALPLAAGLATATFIGTGWIIRKHIRQYHNKIAQEYLQQIIQQMCTLNCYNPDFTETTRLLGELEKSQYTHLNTLKKELETKLNDFKKVETKFLLHKEVVQGQLKAAKEMNGSNEEALNTLEKQVEEIYSTSEDISTLSQKITEFKAVNNEKHIQTLLENIELLIKYRTAEPISPESTVADLVESIKNLQIKILKEF